MSLKGFHLLFITISTLLAAVCAAWCLRGWQEQGSAELLAGGVFSALSGVGLMTYGAWFWRKLGRLP